MRSFCFASLGAFLVEGTTAALIYSQNDTFNSSFTLTAAQKTAANLTAEEAHNVEVALQWEQSNYAGGSVRDDAFYDVPDDFDQENPPPPGTLLKLELFTNLSLYTIPPSLTMSRFLYTTETLNGTSIPSSAYILWPYTPRAFNNLTSCSGNGSAVFPLVGLAHGTSGQTPECAPSHIRNLYDEFHEPFPLALAGYAVVAPDYLGLGVSRYPTPYFVLPSQANDLAYAIAAAQEAFPNTLSKEFVAMGQSQGGGVAWSFAQRQADRPMAGYLGTVAVSPFTDILADITADPIAENSARVAGIAQELDSVLPSFQLSDWLTDAAIARRSLLHDIGGCQVTGGYLFSSDTPFLKDGWNETEAAVWYSNTSDNGNRTFAGPMLVMQGDSDGNANVHVTNKTVDATCQYFPESTLQYVQYTGIGHVPALYAQQYRWLQWIADRFSGVPVPVGCVKEVVNPVRGTAGAQQNWFIEYDEYGV